MHELSIAQNVLGIIRDKFTDKPVRISQINMKIGSLTCILPESLTFCFDSIKKDSVVANSKLNIEILAGLGHCDYCRDDVSLEMLTTVCPQCARPDLKIIQGQELQITSVEIEEDV